MFSLRISTLLLALFTAAPTTLVHGLKYTLSEKDYNLNQNPTATNPLDYSGQRDSNHTYAKSPDNWRFPFYTVFLDRYANGDPTNDDANGTIFETDYMSTQLRAGGDLQGLIDSLDYIAGMGIKAIYIAGSPFINLPWGADGYSPLDLTLLDKHFGDIAQWQKAMDEIHNRNMYVLLDNTMATLGDLIGFNGYLNTSTPFLNEEHKVSWKSSRRYLDFDIGNEYNETCEYPTFWYEDGYKVNSTVQNSLKGCYNSDFDQYGDIEAFGVFPDWQRQLAKFASVQDRLREWVPSVRERLEHFSCLTIGMLDIDGFRVDKAMQVTVDAQASFSDAMRTCAKKYGKDNFMVVGEITAGNTLGSVYLGRGRSPDMKPADAATAMTLDVNSTDDAQYFIREEGLSALDAGAFHYSVYRYLTRFLGMSGNLEAGYDLPTDWVQMWNEMILTNDFYNVNTGEFDPRHLFGVTNQDVFRWPAVEKGIERMLLGHFITTLTLPGIPLMYYGEEQGFYVLDSTASNYVFGRQAMSPALAWKRHGCFSSANEIYTNWPVSKATQGCNDASVALDHRDPSAPLRNTMKHMFSLRDSFPVLSEGWLLQQLAAKTTTRLLNGSSAETTFGIWSVARGMMADVQNATSEKPVWLVYHNNENTTTYTFDCSDASDAFLAPYDAGTTVQNLFNTDDTVTLEESAVSNKNWTGTSNSAGCLSSITMKPFEYRAYVPQSLAVTPGPMITKFVPGHDAPIDSTDANGQIEISLHFNMEMDCDSITNSISVTSTIDGSGTTNTSTFSDPVCTATTDDTEDFVGYIATKWSWTSTLSNLEDGVHRITLDNALSADNVATNSTDHFLIRFGQPNNPVVFPESANYSSTLLTMDDKEALYVTHTAPGASKWRYSTNWGSSWSNWIEYATAKTKIVKQSWDGTTEQAWDGEHVIVQYWSQPLGSSAFVQHSDVGADSGYPRRFPHVFLHGDYNQWGYDAGLASSMDLVGSSTWELHFMYEWPANFQMNVWGINPDAQPDQSFIYGDIDDDGVIDRLPPSSLSENVVNITSPPAWPALSYKLRFNDATWTFSRVPQGHVSVQILLFILLAIMPVVLAGLAGWAYVGSFYRVKVNKVGFSTKVKGLVPMAFLKRSKSNSQEEKNNKAMIHMTPIPASPMSAGTPALPTITGDRRTVLIATMEYNIDDWGIGIKIGGLGVMAKLMSTALSHVNLVWVVPCIGGIDYPIDTPVESMFVSCMGEQFEVMVQYHKYKNITYVLLDAPIFRQQTKAEPYMARMDDVESAILYAAWNSCIAETMRRFPVDIYHINDYHGAAAPLYLLPQTIPTCLSLHNAEFQGLWPMRTPEEQREVCDVFGLPMDIVKEYVQYGSVFNLLHAGASYLRLHQRGFGAVGVSKKYGDRSLARYPIFWSLKEIGQLPNPDPSDTAEWNPEMEDLGEKGIKVDPAFEAARGDLRRQAQEWAGLEVDPTAELFVFVGRWSVQKGCDLIADIFPSILEKYPKTQLIAVGPVIDLYGRFAALKLEKLVEKYPRRVFSKPEFTQLPPYIFSGAEFALIPSRDEPFGLVAVEFGRKGALGVGARVGGLGQMPGFWYTVESMTPAHLLDQFKQSIVSALETKQKKRAVMRAWSAKQRFPVAQWVRQLDSLYAESIRIHNKEASRRKRLTSRSLISLTLRGKEKETGGDFLSRPGTPSGRPASPNSALGSPPHANSPMLHGNSATLASPSLQTPTFPWANLSPGSARNSVASSVFNPHDRSSMVSVDSLAIRAQQDGPTNPGAEQGLGLAGLELPKPGFYLNQSYRNSSQLSLPDVVGDRQDMKLQKVDLSFTDNNGEFYAEFEEMLAKNLTAKNSHNDLCIETFLKKSEKQWFSRYRDAKLGRSRDASRTRSPAPGRPESRGGDSRNTSVVSRGRQRRRSLTPHSMLTYETSMETPPLDDEFLLGDGYKAPTGLKKLLSIRIGDWPIYSFLLALGQVISVNSYQIVLLTGETTQTPVKLYIVAASYLVSSVVWWLLVRNFKSVYALSIPWIFFGLAFMMLGVAPFVSYWQTRIYVQTVATAFYAAGASFGSLSFALNFGDEGGSPTRQWITRALAVSGVQQVFTLALWYWGSLVSNSEASATGFVGSSPIPMALVICVPLAFILWAVGVILYLGLPDYYRQSPESIPGLYISLMHRKLVPWFFVMIIIQNYWLSAPYGRNWQFLFASQYVPGWGIFLLALGFFVGLWAAILYGFSFFSERHTWLLPIFAIGLGAPRWAQMLWGTSGIGWYLPWAGGPVGSAILSRCLWLWLGLLDAVQGVGLGMMLLATLTRQHVMAVLIGAQILGSAITMLARATSPNKLYATATFPDFSQGLYPGVANVWFWVCLAFQLAIPIGFFKFFRKEQVAKP
ncbi:alpha amylase [Pseudomassariella vexata]|uniref:alpha-1,3-glucan synthase n=1 Tax=Pseudomassariella vexata TaxID=1141098 RepID=A0A1Y2DQJ9_9PEZI|nr:alpha amylase [Pseudomassariella vexata]ORY61497.1 alpha amylase [Pseudomassariella vexata]